MWQRRAQRDIVLLVLAALLAAAAPAGAAGFDTPLPIPPVLSGPEITIPIREADVQVLPGAKTRMWTFAGSFPGPTIRRPAGSRTRVTFVNDLPSDKGALTIHHHGEHAASADDGQPDDELIPAGGEKTYTYDLEEDGRPERPAFQWYHDHRLDVTGRNVWNGLVGMFIVDDPVGSEPLPLPSGEYDVPLMVADRSFDAANQLTYPDPVPFGPLGGSYPGTGEPPEDLITGTRLLVNGADQPHLDVAEHRYRLRLLNASNSRVMTFSLEGALPMQQIATESGLLPAPVERTAIELGPAERAEVVVDFAGRLGRQIVLRADGTDLVQFRVTHTAADDSSVPAALAPAPDLGTPARTRAFDLALAEDPLRGRQAWAVNGRTFDHTRTDAGPKLGTTETWVFNGAARTHVVHVHGTDFRVLSRDGAPPPPWERGLKESIIVRHGETVVVRLRFTDHLGAFVFHCHVLEHEDNGMMARYVVSEAGDGGVAPQPPPEPDPGPQVMPPPTTPATSGGRPDLELRWARTPRRIAAGAVARLRLAVRSIGSAVAPAAPLAVRLTGGLASRPARRTRLSIPIPALAPGEAKTVVVAVHAPRRLRSAAVTARIGAHRATAAYRPAGRALRRTGATASAARGGLLCRL